MDMPNKPGDSGDQKPVSGPTLPGDDKPDTTPTDPVQKPEQVKPVVPPTVPPGGTGPTSDTTEGDDKKTV